MKAIGLYENGNYKVMICNDGTKIRMKNTDGDFKPLFPENIDMKISNKCKIGCKYCHENSLPDGDIADFEKFKPFLSTLKPYTELALGGGAISSIPIDKLEDLLQFLKFNNIITNVTINQFELEDNSFRECLTEWIQLRLIYGVGVSFSKKTDEFEKFIKKFRNNAVVHVIAGVVSKEDLEYLASLNVKILILGYKEFRRGIEYSNEFKKVIENRKEYLKNNLKALRDSFITMSFDCLAVEQLCLKDIVNKRDWERSYMGDDGKFTMYVDLVSETFGVNSTTPLSERYKLDPYLKIDEIFSRIRG